MKYGFWVDLNKKLWDAGASSWIHALPVGTYEHPVYGTMNFTPERIAKFASSVNNRIRGIDPDIDYDHKDRDGKAAGWVKAADIRPDGLYLQVNWTDAAAQAIKAGEYRYFSPEFQDEWTDAKNVKHEDVLFGGALTNRPFLKDLLPVNLSEITQQPQGGKLDPKMLRATLKLAEDASDEVVLAEITKLAGASSGGAGHVHPMPAADGGHTHAAGPPAPAGQMYSDDVAKALAENPMFKQLQEGLATAQRQLAEAQAAAQLAEVKGRLRSLQASRGGRTFILPPAVIDAIAEGSAQTDPKQMSEKMLAGLEAFVKTGFVELGERGRTNSGPMEKDASQQLSEAVVTLRANHFKATGQQLSYKDAITHIARHNPEVYDEYRRDTYAFVESE